MTEAALPDDLIQPFHIYALGVYGRLVRPGPTVNQILDRRAYPSAVSSYLMAWVCMRRGQCALPASVSIKRVGTLVQSSPSGEHAELADGGII